MVSIGSLAFKINSGWRYYINEQLFAYNRKIQKIDAKVVGYSFEINKRGKAGGYNYSYFYGVEYQINNQTFFGRALVAENENKTHQGYLPLPETLPILINKNKPEQFAFLQKHTHYGIFWWLLDVTYIVLSIIFLLAIKKSKASDTVLEWDKSQKLKSIFKNICWLLLAIVPFLIVATNIFSNQNSNVGKNVTGFTLILKKGFSKDEVEKLKRYHLDSYDMTAHRNLEVSLDKSGKLFSIATLENFTDKTVTEVYLQTGDKSKNKLTFSYNKNDLDIILEDEVHIKEPEFNIYLYSKKGKYFLPVDIISNKSLMTDEKR